MKQNKTTHSTMDLCFIIMGITVLILLIGGRDIGHYPAKIWLHRCNSMEKLYEKHQTYPNVEVDVVFRENNVFDVTHDLETSYGLHLDNYFAFLSENKGKIWLDIKNLNADNRMDALAELDRLTQRYQVTKRRIIVESSDWKALKTFTKHGYYTSLYITFPKPCELEDEEITDCINQLQKIIDKKYVYALSFPAWWYSTIKEELNRSVDLLTWKHRSTQLQLFLSSLGRKMLTDPQLKVILVKDKGEYHR